VSKLKLNFSAPSFMVAAHAVSSKPAIIKTIQAMLTSKLLKRFKKYTKRYQEFGLHTLGTKQNIDTKIKLGFNIYKDRINIKKAMNYNSF